MSLGEIVIYRESVAQVVSIDSNKPNYHDIIVYHPDVARYEVVSNVHSSYLTKFTEMKHNG